MTREEAITRYNAIKARGDFCEYLNEEMVDMAIKALSQEPCDDAISRKPNCIDCIHKSVCFRLDMRVDSDYAEKCGDFLTELPSVTQKPIQCDDAISQILKRMWNCRGKHTTSIDKVKMEQIIRDELPPVTQKSGKWIPVSERLPKPYEQVLRTVKSFGWNSDFHVHVDIASICPVDTDVLAWMPLPKPYEPKESEEQTE